MNGISRTIVPQSMVRPLAEIAIPGAEPPAFFLQEFVVMFWRVRQWELTLTAKYHSDGLSPGEALYQTQEFSLTVIFDGMNLEGAFHFPAQDVGVPRHELQLNGKHGTRAEKEVACVVHYTRWQAPEVDPGGAPVEVKWDIEATLSASLEIATFVARKWHKANWPMSIYYPTFNLVVFGLPWSDGTSSLVNTAVTSHGYVQGEAGKLTIEANQWETKFLTMDAASETPDFPGTKLDYATGVLKPYRYWPYADQSGSKPKFDINTGEPITFT